MTTLRKELAADLSRETYDVTEQGIYFPRQGVLAQGEYFDRINGGEWSRTKNKIVIEGLAHILNVALGSTAKPAGYFLALFSGAAAPADNWTAASFAATASEIVSLTEGYTSPTRPAWTSANTNTGSIDNMAAVATVTIATAGQLNVTGAAMLTNNTRGGTTGALVSATKYAAARVFQNGDTYDIGYRLSLTV
ncbi:hypothetical protein JVX96_24275 [Variovorax sp. PDNC026]|uniref:hypothetical protein n=1 Tax=Variovorax sp. PDNC026 TaxID=2811425 RepID=UPI0019650835|nr:hypothetical protein [Variovorax sp. PDNC026]QRY31165.1 hypothetical protein JVX96_24275 [Variovorax sp. PDNC026]